MKSYVQLLALASAVLLCESLGQAGDFVWSRAYLDNSAITGGVSYLLYEEDEDDYDSDDTSASNSIIEAAADGRSRSNSAGHTIATETAEISVNPNNQNVCQVLSMMERLVRVQRDHANATNYVDDYCSTGFDVAWDLTRVNGSATSTDVTVCIDLEWGDNRANWFSGSVGLQTYIEISGIESGMIISIDGNNKLFVALQTYDGPYVTWTATNTIYEEGTLHVEFETEVQKDTRVSVYGGAGVGGIQYGALNTESLHEGGLAVDINFTAN